jgi:hypothetical protein
MVFLGDCEVDFDSHLELRLSCLVKEKRNIKKNINESISKITKGRYNFQNVELPLSNQ